MTLPTRDELVEKMALASYEESRKIHREICARGFFGKPHEPLDEHELPPFEALGRRDKKYRLRRAEAALAAIESVIPVGRILSGEDVVKPKVDSRMLQFSDARVRDLLNNEKELRFLLESTPAIRFNLTRALLMDRALLDEAK